MFRNDDFGYYKVTIERPDRRKARFTDEAIAPLRFDKSLVEVMTHVYTDYGDQVYADCFLKNHEKAIIGQCDENDITLNTKNKKKLFDTKYWLQLKALLERAESLMQIIGSDEFDDFNVFFEMVDAELKAQQIKLSAADILALEQKAEGLIADILGVDKAHNVLP